MKKSFKIISALILSSTMAFGLGATIFASQKSINQTEAYYSPSTHYEVSDTASELASYYSSITDSMSGSSLLSALQSLNASKRKKTIGYSAMGTSASSSCYVYTDYDPNYTTTDSNGQTYGTQVLSFYTKTSSTEWNREHVWPNSHGGGSKGSSTGTLVDSDVYMPRPTISSENSSRGNSYYVEGLNHSSNGWDPKTAGYAEWVRGECARIILYCVVANTSLTLNNNTSSSTPDAAMGKMETLIKWHYAYSPSEYEINRNNGGQYLQGNRNPFVDHPEYVSRIWGVSSGPTGASSAIASQVNNASSTYDSWVAGIGSTYGTNDAVGGTTGNSVTISSSGKTMTVGDTDTLYATSSDSSNITWTTSNSSVCSLNKTTTGSGSSNTVTLTAVAAGSATITAKATIGGHTYQKTCAVTVNAAGSQNNATAGTIVPGDLATAYETNSSGTAHTSSDGNIGFKTYQCANYSSKIQWKKSTNAFLYSTTSLNLSTIKINGASGGALTVYGDNTAGGTSNTITGSNGTYDLSGYKYFYIKNASSSAAMATSIEVSTASTQTASITLDKSSASVAVNGTVNLTATATGGTGNVTWSTSNSSIAQLSTTSGTSVTVTGKAAGTATITASYSGKTATCTVTVTSSTPTVNSVTVSPSTLSLNLNGTKTGTLTATVSVSNGAAQTVNWTSSNTSIATVSTSGVVTAKAVGTCTVTATSTVDNTKSASCTVSVSNGSSSSGTEYQKVTSNSDLTSGQYLIVYEAGNVAFDGSLTTLDAVSNTIPVTISNSKITKTTTTSASEFTVDMSAGTIKSASNKYIGNGSNSNALTSSDTALTNTITLNGTDVDVVSEGGAYLRYNHQSGQTRFRYFKTSSYSSMKAIQFYKLNSGSTTTKTLSSIAVSNATTTYTVGDEFVKPTVTATYSDTTTAIVTSSATFEGYDMSTAGTYTVNVSYTEGSVTKTTSYSITVNAGSSTTKTYQVVTSASDLSAGDKVVVVGSNNDAYYYMTGSAKSETLPWYLVGNEVTPSNNQISGNNFTEWTVGKSGTYFTFTNNSNDLYGYVNGTHYSLNLGPTYTMNSTTTNVVNDYSGVNTWTYTITDSSTGAATLYANSSANVYLEYYNSSFCGYKNAPVSGSIFLFKEVTTTTNPALEFAQNFLSAFTCDATGTNAPTFASGKSWASLKTAFQALTTPHQNTLKNATANESGTDIEKAVARYDYVVAKYGYENFMDRTITNSANKMNAFNGNSTNNILLILGSISLLGGLTYLAYFLKKRKED